MQILPNGTAWIPNLVQTITDVITKGGQSITVDQKLIDGPNPNNRGKIFIPLILAFQVSFGFMSFLSIYFLQIILKDDVLPLFCLFQYFFVIRRIQAAIRNDIESESKPLWELRDMGLADRKF